MRSVVRLVACAALALSAAACTPVETAYFREGIGSDLYWSNMPNATALQNVYLEMLCRQSAPVIGPGQDPSCDGTVPVPTQIWPIIVQAGMNDIDLRCDAYLAWLDQRKRENGAILAEISAIRVAADAILNPTITHGVGPRTLAAVAAAFGLAASTLSNINSLLLQVDHTTVQSVVFINRHKFREEVSKLPIDNRPMAIHTLRSYLTICMPMTISANINATVTVYQQGGPAAVDRRPLVPPPVRMLRQSIPDTPRGPLPGAGQKNPPPPPGESMMVGANNTEKNIPQSVGRTIQTNLCISPTTNNFDSARDAIQQAKRGANQGRVQLFNNTENRIMNAAEVQIFVSATSPPCVLDQVGVGHQTAFEKFRFPDDASVTSLQEILRVCDDRLRVSGKFDVATRDAIVVAKGKINQARRAQLTDLNTKTLRDNSFAAIQATCR